MNNSTETLAMLIRFFNMQAGTSCRWGNESNQCKVDEALTRADEDIKVLKNHIREWVKENPNCATEIPNCLTVCMEAFEAPVKVQEVPATPAQNAPISDGQVQYSMGILEQAVIGLIAKTQTEKIESEIMGGVQQTIKDFIQQEYGHIERHITLVINDKKKDVKGVLHEKFDAVLKFVSNKIPVFLTGPAGSGKNILCKQIAEALDLDFYFTNAVSQEYKLTGFTDAMGNYQESQFYKAFKNGGLFMLDEMDASIPEVLVILNAAIANGYFDFPAPIGYVEAHPDFRVIAAGNTLGQGADFEYVGRNQLDAASLNRFAVVRIDYSETIENSVAGGDIELANFCRDFRKAAQKAGILTVVSYRNIEYLAKMCQLLTLEEALDTCLIKGMDKDDIHHIAEGISRNSKYKTALESLAA